MDPRKLRPRRDWLNVLAEPRKERLSSGIYLPGHETGVEKVSEGAGTIIRIGPGDKAPTLGLKEGQRILYRGFIKYANPIEHDEKWEDGTAKHYFLMSIEDAAIEIDADLDIGVFSGRPQVPERK